MGSWGYITHARCCLKQRKTKGERTGYDGMAVHVFLKVANTIPLLFSCLFQQWWMKKKEVNTGAGCTTSHGSLSGIYKFRLRGCSFPAIDSELNQPPLCLVPCPTRRNQIPSQSSLSLDAACALAGTAERRRRQRRWQRQRQSHPNTLAPNVITIVSATRFSSIQHCHCARRASTRRRRRPVRFIPDT